MQKPHNNDMKRKVRMNLVINPSWAARLSTHEVKAKIFIQAYDNRASLSVKSCSPS
jgi:hypothetical protein